MASQQVFQAYPQNKGTLIPGQTISVNNYTIQVERYLSQGGFAHVYLVRTPTPVYNTTHHVLKRIAVANESMLTDVKKEVDIMRLLKGHPNIVHLIDAAWHKLPNGTFEVFILMEFCPGGGIIDMMNRRLRERLTEAEILQIFVDVCEGVAYMHNSRPPLLHRDLKVENILQSSPTSFKLCDFGSATTVSNAPTNMQEIRALEADLNRHTTLQYRAPEMVDVYSKRPVNEKSDVWALGVLLYKLCYYTTPFEEHGPLAILNVQYRIPPYPIYSQEMNTLIGSMLREHGAQRPTVFELLNHVHSLRGTKSKFSYNIPVPPPLLPRTQPNVRPSPSPNPLEGTITYAVPPATSALSIYNDPKTSSSVPVTNQGIQARDRVLEAIAPMRRGRPTSSKESLDLSSSRSRPSSPRKSQSRPAGQDFSKDDNDFAAEKDRAWKAATEKTSAYGKASSVADDAWNLQSLDKDLKKERADGFGDDFAQKLWSAPDPNSNPALPRLSPRPNVRVQKLNDSFSTGLAFTGISHYRPKADHLLQARDKDAFEGLGLMTNSSTPKMAPTLGEARKLRTGLAIMGSSGGQGDYLQRDATNSSNGLSYRPSPSPQPRYLSTSPLMPQSVSPVPTPGSSHSSSYKPPPRSNSVASPQSANADGMPIESRFPSLEELDAQFSPTSVHATSAPAKSAPINSLYPSSVNDASSRYTTQMTKQADNRSQYSQRINNIRHSGSSGNLLKPSMTSNVSAYSVDGVRSQQVTGFAMREQKDARKPESRPSLSDRSNGVENTHSQEDGADSQPRPLLIRKHRSSVSMKPAYSLNPAQGPSGSTSNASLPVPPKLPPRPSATTPPRDWLTGDDQDDIPVVQPTPEMPIIRDSPSKRASFIENRDLRIVSSAVTQHVEVSEHNTDEPSSADLSPTVSRFKRAFPAVDNFDAPPPSSQPLSTSPKESWSPVRKELEIESSADEGPEDAGSLSTAAQKRQASKARGRQSSVHDLVHQYGGGLQAKEKEKERERLPVQYSVGTGNYVPCKPRPSGPGLAPPTKVQMDRKTPSPTANAYSFSTTSTGNRPLPPLAVKPQITRPQPVKPQPQAQVDAKSPGSARSRPQSMFIFPSKSVDSSSVAANSLAPPQETKPRPARRTSISDMVQRYESIGGVATIRPTAAIPAGPPSPIHRPVSIKANPASLESEYVRKTFPEPAKPMPTKTSMSSSTSVRAGGDPPKERSPSKEPARQTTTSVSRSPSKIHRKFTSEAPAISQSSTVNTPRPRRISVKANASAPSHQRTDPVTPRSTKVATTSNTFGANRSPRKPTISLVDDGSAKSDEPRSPSPERPYQGVGKLIDQWQKKSAEADQSRGIPSAKRSDIMSRRAGIVNGDDR